MPLTQLTDHRKGLGEMVEEDEVIGKKRGVPPIVRKL